MMKSLICNLGLLLIISMVFVSGTKTAGGYPRTNRGFKNAQLSTARGFGKRGDMAIITPNGQSDEPSSLPVLNFNSRLNYPNSWLVEELMTNPQLLERFVNKFIDENGDGELNQEELMRRFYF